MLHLPRASLRVNKFAASLQDLSCHVAHWYVVLTPPSVEATVPVETFTAMAETLEAKARAMLLSLTSSAASPPSLKARIARKQAELETNAGAVAGKQTVDQRSAGAGASSRRTSQSSNAGTDMMQFKFGQDRQHAAHSHSSGATPASPADPRPLQYSFARSGTSQPSSPDFSHGRLQQSIAADPRMISFMSEMRSPALSRSRPASTTVFSSPSMAANSPDARLAEIRRRSQLAQSQSTRSPAAAPRRLGESDSSSSHGNTLHEHASMYVDRQSAVGQPQQLPRSPSFDQRQNRTLDLDDDVSPQQLRRASSLAARAAAAQSLGRTPLAELSQAHSSRGRKGADGTTRPGIERARQAATHEGHASSATGPDNSPRRALTGGRPATAEEVTDAALRTARVLNVDEGEIYTEAAVDAAPAVSADEDGQLPVQGVAIHIRLSSPSRSPSGVRRRDVTPRQQRLLEAAGEGQEGTVQPQPQGMKARELSPEQRRHVHALATAEELAGGILPVQHEAPLPAQASSSRSDIAALAQQISGLRDQLGLLLDKQRQQQEQQPVVQSPPSTRPVPEGAGGQAAVVVLEAQDGDSGRSSRATLSPEDPTYAATIAAVAAAIDAAEALLPADSEAVLRAGRRVAQEAHADLARQAGAAVDSLHKMRGEVAVAGQAEAPGTALDMAPEELSALAAPGGPLYAALFDPSDPHALINVLGPEVMAAAVAPAPAAAAPPLAAPVQTRVPSPASSHRAPQPVPPSLTHAALQAERAEVVSLADQLEAELQAVRQERQLYNAKVAANLAQGVAHGAPLDGGVRSVAAVPSTSTASPSMAQGVEPLRFSPDELYRQFMGALDALDGIDTAAAQLEQLRADAAEAEAQKQSLALATEWQQQSEAAMVAAQLSALADQAGQEGARVAGQYAHAMENAYAGYANTQAELLAALVSNVQAVERGAAEGRAGQEAEGTAPSRPIIVPDRTAIAHDYREALTAQASSLDQESMLSVSTEGGLEGTQAGGASGSGSTARAADPAAQLLQSYAADLKRRMEAEMSMIDTASKASKAKLRAEVERIQARAMHSSQPPTEAAVLARAKYTAVTKYKAERARLAGKRAQVHQKYYEELLRFRRTAKSVSRAHRAGPHAMRAEGTALLDSASLDGSLLSLGGADPLLSTSTDSTPGFEMPTLAPGIPSLGATQDMLSSMMSSAASSFVEALMRSMVTAGLHVAGVTQQQSMANTGLASTMVDHDALSRAGTSVLPWVDQPNELVTSIQVHHGPIVEDGHNVIVVAQVGGDGGSRESTPVGSGGLDAGPGVFEALPMPGSGSRSRATLEHIHELADRFTGDVLNKSLDEALNVMLPARGLVSGSTGTSSSSSVGGGGGGDLLGLDGEEGDLLETSASLVALPFAAPKPAVDAVRPKAAPAASRATRKEPSSISPRSPLSPGRGVGALSPPLSKGRDEGFPTTSPDSTGPVHPLATAGVSSEEEDDLYDIEPPAFSSSLAFSPGTAGRLATGMGGRMGGQAASSPLTSPTRTVRRTELTPREQWLAHATSFLQDVLAELGEEGLLDALVHAATGTAPILPRASLQAVELRYAGQGERGADYLSADTRALLFDVWNEDIERMAQQHPAAMAHLKGIAVQALGGQGLGQHPVLLDLAARLKGILSSRVAAMAQSWDTDPTQSGAGGEKERAALLLKADALARVSVKQSKRSRAGADTLTLHAEQDRGALTALPGSPNTAADLITDELIRELLDAL